ncbi:hypothetical protein SUGI_0038170 [Cryptomeria japonica]|uniref:uncharacterized protein LOC131039163 n=1 Tax=Cryptomeria japonica TaxID=3369 RepID=UPI002408972B|nr:uncharacterized protein LOC131039163 [Cryptomeria japonica]GLJ06399.1 hypothetical protein SUGI_0038170 [Cryptomeria japonica]
MAEANENGNRKMKKRSRSGMSMEMDAAPAAKVKLPQDDLDLNLSREVKDIISAIQQIRDKAHKDGQKKTQEIINGVSSEVKAVLDEAKLKYDKERQNFIKVATKTCKECENALKVESSKFQSAYENFCKEKASFLQAYKEIYSRFEDDKEKLLIQYEQQRKKEKNGLVDLQKLCSDKIAAAEDDLKKQKRDDKSFSILRKSLDSFLESGSDEDDDLEDNHGFD